MPKHHKLELSENERQKLVELRDKGEPAYLRERAAALLKIHEGSSPHKVALKGLLKKTRPRHYLHLASPLPRKRHSRVVS